MTGSDPRSLAHQLAARSDASLAALFAARRVAPNVSWNDAFDAAESLLEPASLARAITDLTAVEAATLSAAIETGRAGDDATRDALIGRALLDDDGAPWDAVAQAFRAAAPGAQAAPAAAAPPLPGGATGAATPETDAAAAERAFTASASLADVLQSALSAPLGRIGSGTLGAVDRRRLIESGAVADPSAADELVDIAERTGLLGAEDRALLVTPRGLAWLHSATLDRWSTVADGLIRALPAAVRAAGGGWIAPDDWAAARPFDPTWPAHAVAERALLVRWALLGPGGAPPSWARPAQGGAPLDLAALAELLPPEVDRVYLQNDLTAIAPGSLAPDLDMRLRSMARRESRAQASSYRFTSETIADALTSGETAASLREFLLGLSLTGLPQPLAYEIERSASRHGALQVGPDRAGRTRVASGDAGLLQTIAVDQALRPLGLIPDGDDLITRSSPDTTFWMIADARYPVVAVDADGARRALDRHRLAAEPAPAPTPVEVYADLLARLRTAQEGDADAAWLGRELEQAVRARATIVVAVSLPDGSEREFTIEATGLGGGRLRGLDKNVDVERTLPVSSIVRVRPA